MACVDPGAEVVAAVEDAAAEAEAGRSGAEVSPVAEGGDGGAEEFGGLGDGEQVGHVVAGLVGHGCLLMAWRVVGRSPLQGAISGGLVTPAADFFGDLPVRPQPSA